MNTGYKPIMLAGVALLATLASAQSNPSFLEWSAVLDSAPTDGILSFAMRNLSNKRYLALAPNGAALPVNLAAFSAKNVTFVKSVFGSNTLKRDKATLGDLIALQVGSQFLYVEKGEKRNLIKVSRDPKFEWIAIGVANVGANLDSTMAIGLLNVRAKDFMVHRPGQSSGSYPVGWDKDNKSAAYLRGRMFVLELRKRGFSAMADLLHRAMGW